MSYTTTQNRPLSVTILSYFHILSGIVFFAGLLAAVYYSIFNQTALQAFIVDFKMTGYTPLILIIVMALLTIIALVSGFGMLKGSKVGWHFGGFYYAYNIFRNINALFFIHRPFAIFPLEALTSFINDPSLYYVKYSVRLAVFMGFYIIMNTKKFREYFGLKLEKNLIVLVGEFVILIIIASLISGNN